MRAGMRHISDPALGAALGGLEQGRFMNVLIRA